ncbi:MAG: YcxB family protein [Eubacteriales bacterium]
MNIKVSVQMTVKEMYSFLLQHTYSSIGGIGGTVFGFVCLVYGGNGAMISVNQSSLAILAIGVVFVFGQPIILWNRARQQVKRTPMFRKPIHYELSEEGIRVTQDDQESNVPWDTIVKVTATNSCIIIYFTRMRAFILPKSDLGDQYTETVKMLFTHISNNKVKIRTVS